MALTFPSGDAALPSELATRVESELSDNEQLIWVAQPIAHVYARSSIILVLFGLFWTAITGTIFGAFAIAGPIGMAGNPWGIVIGLAVGCFSLPFLLIGVFLLTAPLWMRRMARKTCYAVTNRRAIIWEPGWFGRTRVRSYTASGLGTMSRVERGDGSGDLVFEEFSTYNSEGSRSTTRRGFIAIPRVREIEELIRENLLKK